MATDRLQVYENRAIRVTFDPQICRHSGVCLRALPAVFDVTRQRWVDVDAAGAGEIFAAVAKCPSRALRAQLVTSVHRFTPPSGNG